MFENKHFGPKFLKNILHFNTWGKLLCLCGCVPVCLCVSSSVYVCLRCSEAPLRKQLLMFSYIHKHKQVIIENRNGFLIDLSGGKFTSKCLITCHCRIVWHMIEHSQLHQQIPYFVGSTVQIIYLRGQNLLWLWTRRAREDAGQMRVRICMRIVFIKSPVFSPGFETVEGPL